MPMQQTKRLPCKSRTTFHTVFVHEDARDDASPVTLVPSPLENFKSQSISCHYRHRLTVVPTVLAQHLSDFLADFAPPSLNNL